jgi:pimeloyl-ACP methyl ester carboxylesterase
VLGVGHSFGSAVTQAVNTQYPASLDATVLTGFSVNGSAVPAFFAGLNLALANENDPTRFKALSDGFLVSGTVVSNQLAFFTNPNFDPNILALAEATKGTLTWGELFSSGAITQPSKGYTGPLAVVNGFNDAPYCFGNCSYPTDLLAEVHPALYPGVSAANFATYTLKGAGHALNLHFGAADAFGFIQNFFKGHGM